MWQWHPWDAAYGKIGPYELCGSRMGPLLDSEKHNRGRAAIPVIVIGLPDKGWIHSECTWCCKLLGVPQAPAPWNVGMLDSADMPALDNTVTFCMTDSYTVHSLIQHHYVCLSLLLPYSIEGDKGSIVDAYLWGSSTDVNSSKQKSTKEHPWPLLFHQPGNEQVPNPSKDLAQMHDPNDTLQ
jgi:hypothetical protein